MFCRLTIPMTCPPVGTTTGISAHDRALTAIKLADPTSKPEDFSRPGHLVPLRAVEGGVLTRRGHTEASVGTSDLSPPSSTAFYATVPQGCKSIEIACSRLRPSRFTLLQISANSLDSHLQASSVNWSSRTTRWAPWPSATIASPSHGIGASR